MQFQLVEITEIKEIEHVDRVFDLSIEDSNSFVANDYVVHNSGNACSTRLKAGVGYPQLSSVLECADAVHGLKGHLMSDGGIVYPADFAKSFGAGADLTMAGSFFAGCLEGGGEVFLENGQQYIKFYGMSSKVAQEKHGEGLKEYRASEGRILKIPFKGSVETIILDLLGSLRSTCSYIGASSIKEMPKRTTFCRVNQQISTMYGIGEI